MGESNKLILEPGIVQTIKNHFKFSPKVVKPKRSGQAELTIFFLKRPE